MISIELSAEPKARHIHVASAVIDGKRYSAADRRGKKSPIPVLCRTLIDQAGVDSTAKCQVFRGKTPCLRSAVSLGYWAKIDIVDRDEGGIHSKPYVAFDRSAMTLRHVDKAVAQDARIQHEGDTEDTAYEP